MESNQNTRWEGIKKGRHQMADHPSLHQLLDQMADSSLFDCPKSLNLSDSLFDLPSEKEINNLLDHLSEFFNEKVQPIQSFKEVDKCNVLPSFQIFDVEGFLPRTFFRTLDTQKRKRSHFDPDEQRSLENYQVNFPSCKRNILAKIPPSASTELKKPSSFAA